jgi:hypothetical protein
VDRSVACRASTGEGGGGATDLSGLSARSATRPNRTVDVAGHKAAPAIARREEGLKTRDLLFRRAR